MPSVMNKDREDTLDSPKDLSNYIKALEENVDDTQTLKNLALFCTKNSIDDSLSSNSLSYPLTPPPGEYSSAQSLISHLWSTERRFDRMLNALLQFLQPAKVRVANQSSVIRGSSSLD